MTNFAFFFSTELIHFAPPLARVDTFKIFHLRSIILTNSLFWVIFVELPFCHFPPPNTSIRGKDSKI